MICPRDPSSCRQRNRPVALAAVALLAVPGAAVALGGCASEGASSRNPWDVDTWSYKHVEDEPKVFAVTSPVAIDVESLGGDVMIEVDEDLVEATVTITREATQGWGRGDEAKVSLDRISSTVELVSGPSGPVLSIRTWTTDPEPWFQRAHVHITLPHADGLRVRTQRGRVWAVDIEGQVDVETSEGGVRVMTNLAMRRPVTIVNRSGDIDYRVRGESTGAIDAATVRGQVMQRVSYGRLIIKSATGAALEAVLNDGTNPIVLRTVDGDIRIAVVSEPTKVGAQIIGP